LEIGKNLIKWAIFSSQNGLIIKNGCSIV